MLIACRLTPLAGETASSVENESVRRAKTLNELTMKITTTKERIDTAFCARLPPKLERHEFAFRASF
ncbi:MAG: hypothetical protein ACRECP_08040 [Methylocella sp.]